MDADDVRRLALALPEATEEPHFTSASYRIRGKIFATVPDDERGAGGLHVMLDDDGIRAAVDASSDWCEELWWGKKLSAARVTLAEADPDVVAELLADAWRRKAPKRLAAAFDEAHPTG